jgi:hypothetical protein
MACCPPYQTSTTWGGGGAGTTVPAVITQPVMESTSIVSTVRRMVHPWLT